MHVSAVHHYYNFQSKDKEGGKLKKSPFLNNVLLYYGFHYCDRFMNIKYSRNKDLKHEQFLFFQPVEKDELLKKLSVLTTMYMDMEIKASR